MSGSVQKCRIRQKCKNEIFISLGGDDSHLIHAQVGKLIQSFYLYIFGGRVVAIRCSPRPIVASFRLRLRASLGAITPNFPTSNGMLAYA